MRCDIEFAFQASSPKTSGPARPALILCYRFEDWSADSNEPLSGRALDPQESEAAGQPGNSAAAAAPVTEPRPFAAARSALFATINGAAAPYDCSPLPIGTSDGNFSRRRGPRRLRVGGAWSLGVRGFRLPGFDPGWSGLPPANLDLARLHGLRHHALKRYAQKPVLEIC